MNSYCLRFIYNFIGCVIFITSFVSCSNHNEDALTIGGFKFGSSKQEVLNVAASKGLTIQPIGAYRLWITGNIQALDMSWDKIDIGVDSVNGIKEIVLYRKYSETTPEMIDGHLNAISKLFPSSERTPYMSSFTITDTRTGHTATSISNYGDIYELKDDKNEYTGGSYFIIDKDIFATVIDKQYVK